MDSTPKPQDLTARMEAQRERLRGMLSKAIDHIERRPMPETPIEDFRHLRSLEVADRLTVALYTPAEELKPARRAAKPDLWGHSGHDDRSANEPDDETVMRRLESLVQKQREGLRKADPEYDAFCAAQEAMAEGDPDPDPADFFSNPADVAECRMTHAMAKTLRARQIAKQGAPDVPDKVTHTATPEGPALASPETPEISPRWTDPIQIPAPTDDASPRISAFSDTWPPT